MLVAIVVMFNILKLIMELLPNYSTKSTQTSLNLDPKKRKKKAAQGGCFIRRMGIDQRMLSWSVVGMLSIVESRRGEDRRWKNMKA